MIPFLCVSVLVTSFRSLFRVLISVINRDGEIYTLTFDFLYNSNAKKNSYKTVVTKFFNKAGQLLTSTLVAGHIKCYPAIYYTQLTLAIKTALQNKLNLY
jgi:hypothetical protein